MRYVNQGPSIKLDCSYPERHERAHQNHPVTGRLVCLICHPPAQYIEEWKRREAQEHVIDDAAG
jgi:hypothetical protein